MQPVSQADIELAISGLVTDQAIDQLQEYDYFGYVYDTMQGVTVGNGRTPQI